MTVRRLSRDRSATFFNFFPNSLKRRKNVVWQSANSRVTSDHCRVTVQRHFSKKFRIACNVEKTLFDSRLTVAWPPTTVAWPFSDFFQIHPKCLNVGKTLLDSRSTVAWPLNTAVWPFSDFFSKISRVAWNVEKALFDSRPTVAWHPTSVAWPFSDFFQNFSDLLETSINVVSQSCDGRVTSDHYRVTVQQLFSKFSRIAWNVEKTLFDSRPTVPWLTTTAAWPFSDFLQKIPELLKTSKKRCLTVGQRSRDLRPLSRDCSATFFKIFLNCVKRRKTYFDSLPTVPWLPTIVAWPFRDFFQKFFELFETSKKRCLTVGQRSLDLRPLSRDRSAFFFKISSNCLKRQKNVVWQSADIRVTSGHCRVTVQRLFSKIFRNAWIVEKTLFWQSSDGRVTSDHCCVTVQRLFPNFSPNGLKRRENVVWQPADGRVTTNNCCLTLLRLFPKFRHFGWIVAWPSNEFVPVVFANDFAYASWHMFLSFIFFYLSDEQVSIRPILTTGLLLAEKVNPGFFDIKWKIFSGRREFFDFGGKIPTLWFPMRETNSLFSTKTTYLLLQE